MICCNSHFSIFGELVTDLKIIDYTLHTTLHIFEILEILDVRNQWIDVECHPETICCHSKSEVCKLPKVLGLGIK